MEQDAEVDLGKTPRLQRFDLSRLLGGFVLCVRNLLPFQHQKLRQIHFLLVQTLELDDRLFSCRDRRSEEGLGGLAGLHLILELLSLHPLLPKDLVDGTSRRTSTVMRFPPWLKPRWRYHVHHDWSQNGYGLDPKLSVMINTLDNSAMVDGFEEREKLSKNCTKLRLRLRREIGKRNIPTLLFRRSIKNLNLSDFNYTKQVDGQVRL